MSGARAGLLQAGLRKATAFARRGVVGVHGIDVLERDLAAPLPRPPVDSGLTFRRCEEADMRAFEGIRGAWASWSRLYLDRLSRGQICLGCLDGGRAVGYLWLATAPEVDRSLGLRIRPAPDELYAFDLYVLPDYRHRQVGYGLVRQWLVEAALLGRRRAIGIVLTANRPMQMLIRAGFGFKRTRRLTSLQFLLRVGVVVRDRPAR